ncbi:MAG: hypothetical protein JNM21_11975 [Taibaiella sp.]|nr:hypothetical protein [Taibaiella sp.]
MQHLEPFYHWRHLYMAEEDPASPFYGKIYSEFEFSDTIYNYYIHPQWDNFDSPTLYLKILFVDYEEGFAIIEFLGEWNDAIGNDIMQLKRNIIDDMIRNGICKFILIVENVLNFHSSDDSYYEEWNEDIADEEGWIVMLNLPEHLKQEVKSAGINYYVFQQEYEEWRTHLPAIVFQKVEDQLLKRIG